MTFWDTNANQILLDLFNLVSLVVPSPVQVLFALLPDLIGVLSLFISYVNVLDLRDSVESFFVSSSVSLFDVILVLFLGLELLLQGANFFFLLFDNGVHLFSSFSKALLLLQNHIVVIEIGVG